MAILKTIAKAMLGYGSPVYGGPPSKALSGGGNVGAGFAQVTGVVANAATVTVTFNVFPGSGTATGGFVRVHTTSINAATTLQISITGTDGTTTNQLVPTTPATAAGTLIDYNFEIWSDLNLTSITISIIAGTNTSTSDVEVALVP